MARSRLITVVAAGAVLLATAAASLVWSTGEAGGETRGLAGGVPPTASSSFDESTAVFVDQDATSVTRRDANGVYQTVLSAVPERVEVNGEWVPISTELTEVAEGGFAAETHPFFPEFAPDSSDAALVEAFSDGYTLSIGIEGADESPIALTGADAALGTEAGVRYENVLGDADLVIGIDGTSVRQAVVFGEAPSEPLSVTWRVSAPGLEPAVNEFGDVDLKDDLGNVAFSIARASVWDSLGDNGPFDSAAINVDYEIDQTEEGVFTLSVSPPSAWIEDASRVYPIYVDPNIFESGVRGYKQDGYSNTGVTQVGNSKQTTTCCDWRSVVKYELSGYSGTRIISAYLYGYRRSGTSGNNNAQPGGAYTATSFSFGGVGGYLTNFPIGYDGYGGDAGLFNWVSAQVNSSTWTGYLMLRGQEANSVYSYKSIYTRMVIEYVSRPTVNSVTVNGFTPGTVTEVNPDDVVVASTGSNWTPGTSQVFQYTFASSNGGAAWASPWVAGGSYRVPDTALTPGKNYTMTVKTMDTGAVAPVVAWGGSWAFHVQAAPQVVAGSVSVGGATLTDSTEPVTVSVTNPTLSANVSDADGGTVRAMFTVLRNGVVILDSIAGEPVTLTPGQVGTSAIALPIELNPADTYTIEVQAFDGHQASLAVKPGQGFKAPTGVSWDEIPGEHDLGVAP